MKTKALDLISMRRNMTREKMKKISKNIFKRIPHCFKSLMGLLPVVKVLENQMIPCYQKERRRRAQGMSCPDTAALGT